MAIAPEQWLTGLDTSFLAFEDSVSPMHVGSLQINEGAPLRLPSGELDFDRICDYVLSRLHLIPRYRQRLARSPIGGQPLWVDDERFNIRYHMREARLPRPGSPRQLKRMAARILSQQLDHGKPLWEMWVIEGLEDDRIAVISKVHHCMIDGVAGSELLSVLMTTEPTRKIEAPEAWAPQPMPSRLQLAAEEVARAVSTPFRVAEYVSDVVADRDHARGELVERLRAVGRLIGDSVRLPSRTPMNRPIGPHRRIDWCVMDMDRIKRIKRAVGASVNDVVLAIVTGAIRRYLRDTRGTSIEGVDFRVLAPVSVRRSDQHGRMGNHVAAWIVSLPIDEADPLEQLRRIHEITTELKRTRQALGSETLTEAAAWTGTTLLSMGSQIMALGQPFNMVVTNVPGPPKTLYLLESPMLEVIPFVPLMGTLTTGIALFSYEAKLCWGISGDWDLVPDLHDLVLALERAFDELGDTAEGFASAGKAAQNQGV